MDVLTRVQPWLERLCFTFSQAQTLFTVFVLETGNPLFGLEGEEGAPLSCSWYLNQSLGVGVL